MLSKRKYLCLIFIQIFGSIISTDFLGDHFVQSPWWNAPEQIHLSLGASPNQMVVTWVTLSPVNGKAFIRYGPGAKFYEGKMELFSYASKREYSIGKITRYIYRATMNNLKIACDYKYQIYSGEAYSEVFYFRTIKPNNSPAEFLVIGDMGNKQALSVKLLNEEIHNETFRYDMIVHVGDFAYNLEDDEGRVSDAYFQEIQSFAGFVPYQVCPGNHEKYENFSFYNNLFTMQSLNYNVKPNESPNINNFFWSYDIGPMHVIAFTTEFYYYTEYGTAQIHTQYQWLKEDLGKAIANRAKVPWIITMAHRPMYDQSKKITDISNDFRVGSSSYPGLEKLFLDSGVDVSFWGHDHIYERTFPMYDMIVQNGTKENPYENPNGIVHIITGSTGCYLHNPQLNPNPPAYSAMVNRDYSYTRVKVFNSTHLRLQQVSQDKGGAVIDEIMIVKNKHLPYKKPK